MSLPMFHFYLPSNRGHSLLEAARQADVTKVKKFLCSETVNFKDPYTGDSALHCIAASPYPKRFVLLFCQDTAVIICISMTSLFDI